MRAPTIPKSPQWRISTTTAWCMILTALFFDVFQLFFKLFIAVSLAAVAAVSWIPIFGQVLAVVAIGLSIVVDLALSGLVMGCGYLTSWLWFQQHGVRIMEGKFIGRKTLGFFATMLMELMPFMNILPGITLWTTTTILYSWKEDTIRHAKLVHKARMEARKFALYQKEQVRAYHAQRAFVHAEREAAWRAAGEEGDGADMTEREDGSNYAPLHSTSPRRHLPQAA